MKDMFCEYYGEHLDATYDCVDRIVLTAYNPFIQGGGGFRTWWRMLDGNDDNLDNTHLMRFAGHFSRRVRAFAKKKNIPLIFCDAKKRKDEITDTLLPSQRRREGVFCIMVNRAPASVIDVRHYGNGGIDIRKKEPRPYVNHYAFHIIDNEWGHVIIRFCPHPPFNAMIILNGHEYVEMQARKRSISFTKEDNCFTGIPNAAALAGIADTMSASGTGGRLVSVCERWIYSACLCFALEIAEQERTGFQYAYSVFQAEYSRNLLFKHGTVLDRVFNGVIDRTRTILDMRSVKTIFGRHRRPYYKKQRRGRPRFEVVVEKPAYNLTVFKVHFGRLTVKMYSKGERVLRIEAVAHNTADLHVGKSIAKFPSIVSCLADITGNFLDKLNCVDVSFVDAATMERWHEHGSINGTCTAGIDINKPRMRVVMEALIALSINPCPITAALVADKVREIGGTAFDSYTKRQAAYDLRKFRGKGVIEKTTPGKTYTLKCEGLRTITAFIVIRDKVLIPLLSCRGDLRKIRHQRNRSNVQIHMDNIQHEMKNIFNHYRIAA